MADGFGSCGCWYWAGTHLSKCPFTCFPLVPKARSSFDSFFSHFRFLNGFFVLIKSSFSLLSERASLVTFTASGADVGILFALTFSPQLVNAAGWEFLFLFATALSFSWLACFYLWSARAPEYDSRISKSEADYILNTYDLFLILFGFPFILFFSFILSLRRGEATSGEILLPWKTLLTSRAVWGIIIANIGGNYGWYVMLGWIPKVHIFFDLFLFFISQFERQGGGVCFLKIFFFLVFSGSCWCGY